MNLINVFLIYEGDNYYIVSGGEKTIIPRDTYKELQEKWIATIYAADINCLNKKD